jgi:hypothetical protein
MLFRPLMVFCLLLSAAWAAESPPDRAKLLDQAVSNWLGARDHWAFTQRAVEYTDDGKPHERLERYDPSQKPEARWTLLAIDGQTPTAAQHAAWAKKKLKRRSSHRFESAIGEFFDFQKTKVVAETPELLHCEVPLRSERNWLFQADKVKVIVTLNKKTLALEHITAHVREPVKVLFGIAKITYGNVDLRFNDDDTPDTNGPGDGKPQGSVHMNVSRFGERAEFTWSEFKRVTPASGDS